MNEFGGHSKSNSELNAGLPNFYTVEVGGYGLSPVERSHGKGGAGLVFMRPESMLVGIVESVGC